MAGSRHIGEDKETSLKVRGKGAESSMEVLLQRNEGKKQRASARAEECLRRGQDEDEDER